MNEKTEIKVEFINEKVCIVCLQYSKKLQSLFSEIQIKNGDKTQEIFINNILMNISDMKILPEDGLACMICENCINLAEISFKFKQQCNHAYSILKNSLKPEYVSITEKNLVQSQNEITDKLMSPVSVICEPQANLECKVRVNDTDEHQKIANLLDSQPTKANKNITEKPSKPVVHTCNICHKSFKKISSLKIHRQCHLTEKLFTCKLCGKSYRNNNSLTYHLRSHMGEQPYSCKICQKKYKQSGSLTAHMRVHTGQKPFLCSICGKGFRQAPDLGYHMRTHTKEKPYMCNICGKTMRMQCHLVQHMRSHTGEKPYKCKECDKAFPSSTTLKRHEIIHTNLKPFTCDVCEKSFNRRSTLLTHLKIHSDDRPHACSFCGKRFIHVHSLRKHVATHKSSEPSRELTQSVLLLIKDEIVDCPETDLVD